jgi:hypothetical protein
VGADTICYRNLQATLVNGGPRALVWGILIVVAGAIAQSASLAEMASAQPIAGAQYVRLAKGITWILLMKAVALDLYFRTSQPASLHYLDARLDHLLCVDLHSGWSRQHHRVYATKSRSSELPQLRTKSLASHIAHIRLVGDGRPHEHVRMVLDTLARDVGRCTAHPALRGFCGCLGDSCAETQRRLRLSQICKLFWVE